MDTLVSTVIAIVGPYLAKGAEEFAKSVGSAAFGGAKALVERLRRWWSHEPVAEAAAKAFSSDPERYAKVLSEQLACDLAKDESFATDLRKLVEDIGASVDVIQKIEIARGVTGADIGSLVAGHVRVQQDIRDAQNVTGFKAQKVGGN
jgi:hypothetical protein